MLCPKNVCVFHSLMVKLKNPNCSEIDCWACAIRFFLVSFFNTHAQRISQSHFMRWHDVLTQAVRSISCYGKWMLKKKNEPLATQGSENDTNCSYLSLVMRLECQSTYYCNWTGYYYLRFYSSILSACALSRWTSFSQSYIRNLYFIDIHTVNNCAVLSVWYALNSQQLYLCVTNIHNFLTSIHYIYTYSGSNEFGR